MTDGCPECDWNGEIAVTHDRTHRYYTHVIVEDGEMFTGRTCSERTVMNEALLDKLWRLFGGA